VTNKINFLGAVCVPQVDSQHKVLCIDLVRIDFFAGGLIIDRQADARRWSDWPSVFVSEAAHSGSHWLLHDLELVCSPAIGESGALQTARGLLGRVLLLRLRCWIAGRWRIEIWHGGRRILLMRSLHALRSVKFCDGRHKTQRHAESEPDQKWTGRSAVKREDRVGWRWRWCIRSTRSSVQGVATSRSRR